MTKQSTMVALTFGFFASTVSMFPATTAEAKCYMDYDHVCTKGGVVVERGKHLDNLGVDEGFVRCCDTPSGGYATGETKQEREQREAKECAAMGGRYNAKNTPRCGMPLKAGKLKAPAPAPKGPPDVLKPTAAKRACANNEVDVYDSPVEPRSVIGTMAAGARANVLERHPHGWWKMQGFGWVARDHLTRC